MSQPPNVDWTEEQRRRANALAGLYNGWPGDGDPDDDPEFVAKAREIMGLSPLETQP